EAGARSAELLGHEHAGEADVGERLQLVLRPGAGAIALGRGGRDHLGGDPARGVTDEELLLAEKYRRRVAHAVSRLRCTHPAADGSRRVAKAARVRVFPESVDLLCVLCFYF